MPSATISIVVPALPNPEVWFLNEAAWANYWADVFGEVTIEPAVTTIYVPAPYDNTIPPVVMNVDGVDYICTTKAQFDSLLAQVTALDNAVQQMRTALKDADLISQAQ